MATTLALSSLALEHKILQYKTRNIIGKLSKCTICSGCLQIKYKQSHNKTNGQVVCSYYMTKVMTKQLVRLFAVKNVQSHCQVIWFLFDLGLTSLSTFFSHIATVSGCGRELNAHF